MDVFDKVNAEGRTIVLITHEQHVAEHAKRVVRVADGLVVADERRTPVAGPPPQLAGAPMAEAAS